MGYRSDVLIAVAFSNKEHRDEVWAVYCMDQRVKDHALAGAWKNSDGGEYPVLYYEGDYVKWYENYEDVQGIEHMIEVASNFAQERGLHYASIMLRVGEEMTDIEHNNRQTNGDMEDFLYKLCDIERTITHNFG